MTALHWLLIASIPSLIFLLIMARRFVASEFRRHGYEPVDYNAAQDEMDEEFAPVRKYEGA